MKLASLKHGRDGKLVVVSKDLSQCTPATHIAETMQAALDNWDTVAPKLQQLSHDLDQGRAKEAMPFYSKIAASPLPRAYNGRMAALT